MKYISIFILLTFTSAAFAQNSHSENSLRKTTDDDSKYTNVGNIGLTLTNYGTYGNGFISWPQEPSCEYPLGSGIEHMYAGGLWIGGYLSNDSLGNGKVGPLVSTGTVDLTSIATKGGGFEYTNAPGSLVMERSSLLDSRFYDPSAISHQDFLMDFTDTNTTFSGGEIIEGHNPLGVTVHEESYAWNFPFADFFVIMNYTIKNVSKKYLDSVYIGLWTDLVVRNTKITSPRVGTSFYNKGGVGYKDSLHIAYAFDATGDIGYTDSYGAIQYLGSTPSPPQIFIKDAGNTPDTIPSVNFVTWQFRNVDNRDFFYPQNDNDRYKKMTGQFSIDKYWKEIDPNIIKKPAANSWPILLTNGSFNNIAPGDSVNIVFAVVCGKKFGSDPASLDNEEQKKNLYSNAEWALRAYHGEDKNRNGVLDPGEDLDGNGKITRYILPAPPISPIVKVIPESNKATIYWNNRSEASIDPISGKKDFEGYRIYRTQSGFDLTQKQDILSSLVLLAEFDSTGNDIGFNSGFSYVKLPEPVTFEDDTTTYQYKMEVNNLLNGWQYLFSISAFDEGDPENNLTSLESSSLASLQRILPGTLPDNSEKEKIGVYPNPYYGNAYWDGSSERLRKIYFYNLPSECEITIYTLAGDIVKRIEHNSSSNGADIRWFQNYASDERQKMSGGEHAWDLITDDDQAIATGLYLFTVKNSLSGNIQTGKFLVIK